MTCKDLCIHCDVCIMANKDDYLNEEILAADCSNFKPKSRFVELPDDESIIYTKGKWLMLNMESEHLGEAIKRSVDYLTKNARAREDK